MFLLAREAELPRGQRFSFVPYNYGPMSRGVYRAARRLVRDGLVERRRVHGYARPLYVATAAGHAHARRLAERGGPAFQARLARLGAIRAGIEAMGFEELLDLVYRRYPEYAVRSVFRQR
jgi:DNA-binding PadR family transcriptional regulator